ncbi:putative baseplate assembly protein [Actinoplanes ianthinogenes]|uniref:Baseplate assembly protein n=1 Tax=Actinoplanes ianthinogenes TaxID=122358 RepID=A0ABM7LKU7_9ACTN|nr:putative baseplate assembly protein [Actinoplanes ianthinogenes]BCJ39855.1 putative baseplate assembly protein [Actinoplanes ianthinogenes]GGR08608.1 putative baseplate assembly protein [Actinoplanes ianthinogenes]
MPLEPPPLDDRDFDRLVAEAIALIPRYTPEWTDHNDTDPGITLVKLFAWLTDQLIFRVNQVPELHYVKFLQLLGIEPAPARPATAGLRFAMDPDGPPAAIVPLGTQVAVAGTPLLFETDHSLTALRATIKTLSVYDGFTVTTVTEPFHPFGRNHRDGSALHLGFADPGPFPADPIELVVLVTAPATADPVAGFTDLPPPADVLWEFRHVDGEWRPVDLIRDETRGLTRSGRVQFTGPGATIRRDQDQYWFRARLRTGHYDRAPRLDAVLTNTVRATQAQTVRDEVLGGSDGAVGQVLRVARTPVVGDLDLQIDEGTGFASWTERTDLYASGSDDRHFRLNRTTGEVLFGDGTHGRIPLHNPRLPESNVVARRYRAGGGSAGNVGAGRITDVQSLLPDGITGVDNPRPATLGADEETVEQAKQRAPRELQSKGRAVTADDFEQLAMTAPGARIRRARALPLTHPRFPGARVPGTVTVLVVPDADGPRPTPDETTLRAVAAHLDAHRLITTELYVCPPTYRRLHVEADVVVLPNADLAQVKRDVTARLDAFFHPLGWEFGADVYYSDVARTVLDVPGVDRIRDNDLFVVLDGERYGPCQDVELGATDLPYTEAHEITVSYRERQ